MNRKCKVCGYIFKDKDEQICPECFTAREDDISCESYSHDDHCDDSYTHFKEMESKPEYFDETFEDDNSFIEDAVKDEKNNAFAKAEQKQANSVSMGNTRNAGNAKSQNNTGSNTHKSTFTTNNRTYTYNANTKVNTAKSSNKGCLKFIIFIAIIFWILPKGCVFFANKLSDSLDKKSKSSVSSSQSESTLKSDESEKNIFLEDSGYVGKYLIRRTNNPKVFDFSNTEDTNIQYVYNVKKVDSVKLSLYINYPQDGEIKKGKITSIICNSIDKNDNTTMSSVPIITTNMEWGTPIYLDFFIDNDASKLLFDIKYTIDEVEKDTVIKYDLQK